MGVNLRRRKRNEANPYNPKKKPRANSSLATQLEFSQMKSKEFGKVVEDVGKLDTDMRLIWGVMSRQDDAIEVLKKQNNEFKQTQIHLTQMVDAIIQHNNQETTRTQQLERQNIDYQQEIISLKEIIAVQSLGAGADRQRINGTSSATSNSHHQNTIILKNMIEESNRLKTHAKTNGVGNSNTNQPNTNGNIHNNNSMESNGNYSSNPSSGSSSYPSQRIFTSRKSHIRRQQQQPLAEQITNDSSSSSLPKSSSSGSGSTEEGINKEDDETAEVIVDDGGVAHVKSEKKSTSIDGKVASSSEKHDETYSGIDVEEFSDHEEKKLKMLLKHFNSEV